METFEPFVTAFYGLTFDARRFQITVVPLSLIKMDAQAIIALIG